jgi:actin-related protein
MADTTTPFVGNNYSGAAITIPTNVTGASGITASGMIGISVPLITTAGRTITSTYRKSDKSYFISDAARQAELPNVEKEGNDVLVLHPGSRNTRIGISRDALPKTILTAVARPWKNGQSIVCPTFEDIDMEALQDDNIESIVSSRNSILKKRPPPNTTQQMLSYNRQQKASIIAGHNDAFNVEWTKIENERPRVVGQQALLIHPEEGYEVSFPIRYRHLAFEDLVYKERDQIHQDLGTLIKYSCEKELKIDPSTLKDFSVVLVLPDNCHRWEIKSWLSILYDELGFKSVALLQESVAATFGAGIGSACVVDIGAEQTSIALVEDGYLIKSGQALLQYGADHLLPLFYAFLNYYEFPYRQLDYQNAMDIELLQELKERTCTLEESELAVQVIDFYVRQPGKPTQAWQFKSFDERFYAPLALFRPEWLKIKINSSKGFLWYQVYGCEDAEAPDGFVIPKRKAVINGSTGQEIEEKEIKAINWPPEALKLLLNIDQEQPLWMQKGALAGTLQKDSTSQDNLIDLDLDEDVDFDAEDEEAIEMLTSPKKSGSRRKGSKFYNNSKRTKSRKIVAISEDPESERDTDNELASSIKDETSVKDDLDNQDTPGDQDMESIILTCQWKECGLHTKMNIKDMLLHVTKDHIDSTRHDHKCLWRKNSDSESTCSHQFRVEDQGPSFQVVYESHIVNHLISDSIAPKEPDTNNAIMTNRGLPYGVASKLIPLEEAILRCIFKAEGDNIDRIKKWLGSILLVGGGSLFPGFANILTEKLLAGLAHNGEYIIPLAMDDKIGALMHLKDMDPKSVTWKGGCVYSRLETVREFWIPRTEWRRIGMRAFSEKYPHLGE